MATLEIDLVVGSQTLLAELHYDYTPGEPGFTSGAPEDCYPPTPAEYEFTGLYLLGDDGIFDQDISPLLNCMDTSDFVQMIHDDWDEDIVYDS